MQGSTRQWWRQLLSQDRASLLRLTVVGLLGVGLIWWSGAGAAHGGGPAASAPVAAPPAAWSPSPPSPLDAQEQWVDRQLAAILAMVPGAGRVSVAVTLKRGVEDQVASQGSGGGGAGGPVVLSQGNGGQNLAILDQVAPLVEGVVVVAEGAADPNVRQELTDAVETLFDLKPYQVLVLPRGSGP